TQGFRQTTNNPLDLMLEGDGMFAVQDGDDTYYTRAGNFYLDNEGNVVNPDGYYLLDVDGDEITIPEDAESFSIQPNGNVIYIEDGEQGTAGQIGVAMFSNPSGLEKAGSNLFINTDNAGLAEA